MARHRFANTIILSYGVPIETVSKLLGYAKIATSKFILKLLKNR